MTRSIRLRLTVWPSARSSAWMRGAPYRSRDFGVLNLTPFRGTSADVGTVFELGFLTGLGKSVFAYTNDIADLLYRLSVIPRCGRMKE